MWYDRLLHSGLLPDPWLRAGIRWLLAKRLRQEAAHDLPEALRRKAAFFASMKDAPLALSTPQANQQHYEVPTDFYRQILGPRLKYSSCLWTPETRDLASAEIAMLDLTLQRAQITDHMDILDLGCGWGSLSLYLAERFPSSRITALSNSHTQKSYIDLQARSLGLSNLTVITSDMNLFQAPGSFDRILSIEMFEHMRNYDLLLQRIASWLRPDGLLFVHIFAHKILAYPFDTDGDHDWMARHFFTGGLMPSLDIFEHFNQHLTLADQWIVNGLHYAKTLEAWLLAMDSHRTSLTPLFRHTYRPDWRSWWFA